MQFIRKLMPPSQWIFPVIIILGIFFGLSVYSFYISKAHSYLSDNPQTCINCHIMIPQYATWNHSSHREIAHCNDCHVPHNNFFSHYYFKAKDGLRHATIFTLRAEPQVIQIKDAGINVVQQNCIRCHENLIKNAALQVCHREETSELMANVYERQDKIKESRDKLEELLVRAHIEAGKAWELGANDEQMQSALMDIRHAQWRWDYVAASHGGSFHSPIECSRILATGINIAQEARIKLARVLASLDFNQKVPYPDISTKAKAQEYIGLDMEKLNAEKEKFLKEVVPEWDKKAAEREKNYKTKNL